MKREMLRAKVHRVTVTEANLEYEGSLTLDAGLMEAGGFVEFEKIDVYNVERGTRFTTYLIEGERGSGVCCVNGAAAHLAGAGDAVIIASYATLDETEVAKHRPVIVLVDAENRIREVKRSRAPASGVSRRSPRIADPTGRAGYSGTAIPGSCRTRPIPQVEAFDWFCALTR
jgi:aspartate 1-decarboxylase